MLAACRRAGVQSSAVFIFHPGRTAGGEAQRLGGCGGCRPAPAPNLAFSLRGIPRRPSGGLRSHALNTGTDTKSLVHFRHYS